MAKAKSIEGSVDMPEGLDVIPTVPGTFVGGHDVQGADGTERTDRPGEILGTPVDDPTAHDTSAREQSLAQSDFVQQEVDRNNREVLPLLGGPNAEALGWEPDEGGVPEFIANARTIKPKRSGDKGVTTASLADRTITTDRKP